MLESNTVVCMALTTRFRSTKIGTATAKILVPKFALILDKIVIVGSRRQIVMTDIDGDWCYCMFM